ncbi:ASCH/PUA domain-containing protein [Mycobacterium sp. TJFP1]
MSVHELKTWPLHFREIVAGRKTFEVRKNDRGFQVGDVLLLREYSPNADHFTGATCRRTVTYILPGGNFGIADGHVVMALNDEGHEWCCATIEKRLCTKPKGHVSQGDSWHDDGNVAWIMEPGA